jgi:RNA polymerase sigma factor (sigma-70 family)
VIDDRIIEEYEKCASDLTAYAAVVAGVGNAEDVVSAAMIRLLSSANWDEVRKPRQYLFRAVYNEAVRQARRSRLRLSRERLAALTAATDVRTSGKRNAAVDELGVFRLLSERERAVIYLTYWEDQVVAEVAATLGISDGAVRRYLARARRKLRKEFSHGQSGTLDTSAASGTDQ